MGNAFTKRRNIYSRMREDRIAGQQELRTLAAKKPLNNVDWPAVIHKAAELHHKDQLRLRKKEKRWRRRQLTRSKHIRKKYGEQSGVYCVNLLSLNNHMEECFLDDEFDDSYSIYYTMESDRALTEATSTVEYATATESTMECYPIDAATLEDEMLFIGERFSRVGAGQAMSDVFRKIQLEGNEQSGDALHEKTLLEILSDIAMDVATSHSRLTVLTEESCSPLGFRPSVIEYKT